MTGRDEVKIVHFLPGLDADAILDWLRGSL